MKSYIFLFTWMFLALNPFTALRAQSITFEALLHSIYDNDFPLVHPGQSKILENAVILDTREKKEYEVSHLENAKWVGYDTFTLSSVDEIHKDQPIIVYCTVGARSEDIGKRLKKAGYSQVFNLYGGIIHWANEGQPVVKDNQHTPKVHTYNKSWGFWLKKGEKVY